MKYFLELDSGMEEDDREMFESRPESELNVEDNLSLVLVPIMETPGM